VLDYLKKKIHKYDDTAVYQRKIYYTEIILNFTCLCVNVR